MKCPIDRRVMLHTEEHHPWPREYGGNDAGTVEICSQCHHGIHKAASALLRGGDPTQFFEPDVYPRAEPFIEMVVLAKLIAERKGPNPNQNRRVVVNVPNDVLIGLHQLKMDSDYKSLDKFLNDMFVRWLKFRYSKKG